MGFFDFLKPKKSFKNDVFLQMHAKIFPKGQKDMDAVTDALLYILDNKISRVEAQYIAVKSIAISKLSNEFSKIRLQEHLKGYCLHHFSDEQVTSFHGYLTFLIIADSMFMKTPSEVVREGQIWIIAK